MNASLKGIAAKTGIVYGTVPENWSGGPVKMFPKEEKQVPVEIFGGNMADVEKMSDAPRTLALNLRLGHADDATAQRAFHDLAEQLERELAEAYRLAVDPAAALVKLETAEDAERYRWFRDCPTERQLDILELAGEFPEMLDHHIDKGRCGL